MDVVKRTRHPARRCILYLSKPLAQQKGTFLQSLRMSVDKVWNKAIDNVAFLLSKQEYPGPDNKTTVELLYFVNN